MSKSKKHENEMKLESPAQNAEVIGEQPVVEGSTTEQAAEVVGDAAPAAEGETLQS